MNDAPTELPTTPCPRCKREARDVLFTRASNAHESCLYGLPLTWWVCEAAAERIADDAGRG